MSLGRPLLVPSHISRWIAGTVSNPSGAFANDPNTGIYSPGAGIFGIVTNAVERIRVTSGGVVLINDTDVTGVTIGLIINQGSNDNEIIDLRSSDVAHEGTGIAITSAFGIVRKASGTGGGLRIVGLADADGTQGMVLEGLAVGTLSTTKTTAGTAGVVIRAGQISGANEGNVGADGNVAAIQTFAAGAWTTRFIFDTEGSGHGDVEWVAFDKYDDLALAEQMQVSLLDLETLEQHERRIMLEETGIIGKDSWHIENGKLRCMVNTTKLAMFHHSTLIQVAGRIIALEREVAEMKKRPLAAGQ